MGTHVAWIIRHSRKTTQLGNFLTVKNVRFTWYRLSNITVYSFHIYIADIFFARHFFLIRKSWFSLHTRHRFHENVVKSLHTFVTTYLNFVSFATQPLWCLRLLERRCLSSQHRHGRRFFACCFHKPVHCIFVGCFAFTDLLGLWI